MMKSLHTSTRQQDIRVLRETCIKLAWRPLLIRVLVVLVIAILWYSLCGTVMSWAAGIKYEKISLFSVLGTQVLEVLTKINWYIWAGLLLILTLFVVGGVRSYLVNSLAAGRSSIVSLEVIETLTRLLSPEALDVLRWVWKDKEQPVNFGHLRVTLTQLQTGRVRKLALARAQKASIEAALAHSAQAEIDPE